MTEGLNILLDIHNSKLLNSTFVKLKKKKPWFLMPVFDYIYEMNSQRITVTCALKLGLTQRVSDTIMAQGSL